MCSQRAPLVAQAFRPAFRRAGRPEGLRYVRNTSEFRSECRGVTCIEGGGVLSTTYFVKLRVLLPGGSRPVPSQDLNIRGSVPVMLFPVAVALPRPAISHVANP